MKWANGRVTLDEGDHVLGRDPDVEILLDSAGRVAASRCDHDRGGSATIEDLGSKNGTFVGIERVEGVRSLGDGDVIGVGSVKLTVKVLAADPVDRNPADAGPPGDT